MWVAARGGTLGLVPRSTSPWWLVLGLIYALLTEGPEAALQYLTLYSFIIIIIIIIISSLPLLLLSLLLLLLSLLLFVLFLIFQLSPHFWLIESIIIIFVLLLLFIY